MHNRRVVELVRTASFFRGFVLRRQGLLPLLIDLDLGDHRLKGEGQAPPVRGTQRLTVGSWPWTGFSPIPKSSSPSSGGGVDFQRTVVRVVHYESNARLSRILDSLLGR